MSCRAIARIKYLATEEMGRPAEIWLFVELVCAFYECFKMKE